MRMNTMKFINSEEITMKAYITSSYVCTRDV